MVINFFRFLILYLAYRLQGLVSNDLCSIEESEHESQELIPPRDMNTNTKKRNTIMGNEFHRFGLKNQEHHSRLAPNQGNL